MPGIDTEYQTRIGQTMSESVGNRVEGRARIGLIGLGLVGSALVGRLIQAGFEVVGFDVDRAAVERFETAGGIPASGAESVARQCATILLSLPDGAIAADVIDELRTSLEPGSLVIDTTTASPDQVERAAEVLKAAGAGYLDAPLSGSSEVIATGQGAWIVGGDVCDFEAAGPVFAAVGGSVHHVGPVGAGSRAKLVSNLILGLNRAALAEGLALAEAWGLDLPATLEVLKASAAWSRVMDAKGVKMIEAEYRPQARLRQHHKDVRLMLEAAKRIGQRLPLSALHESLLTEAEDAGWGNADNAAIIEVWRGRSSAGRPADQV